MRTFLASFLTAGLLLLSTAAHAATLQSGSDVAVDSSGNYYLVKIERDGEEATVTLVPCEEGKGKKKSYTVTRREKPPVEVWNGRGGVSLHESSRGGHILTINALGIQETWNHNGDDCDDVEEE